MSDFDSSDNVPLEDVHRVLSVDESDEMDQTSWLDEDWAEHSRKKGVTSFDANQRVYHRRLLAFEYVAPEIADPEPEVCRYGELHRKSINLNECSQPRNQTSTRTSTYFCLCSTS